MALMTHGIRMMNYVAVSGTVLGDSDLRMLESGRELLGFELWVDGKKGCDPVIHVGFFPRDGDVREIRDQTRITCYGSLRHRNDEGGLFIAARELVIASEETGKQTSSASRNGGKK